MAGEIEIKPVPEPIPITQKIYAVCQHCKGTKVIILTMGDGPPLEEPCPWCEAMGRVLFGEIE
jgi:DnaJ-class molecular chaperone